MKQLLIIVLLLGAIVGGAAWYYRAVFQPVEPVEVTVEQVSGEVNRGEDGGAPRPLRQGETITEGSRISTGQGGFVRLAVEEGEQVELLDNSEVVIKAVSQEGVNFELKSGRLEANVKRFRDQERSITVGVTGNPAVVRTSGGAFAVVADGYGTMDVAARSGEVNVLEPGKPAEPVPAGERRVVADNGERLVSGKVPRSVLLKVDWPEQSVTRAKQIEVTGEVTPGSRLTVGGQPVRPGRDGRFKASVPVQEGHNQIEVRATGLGDPAVVTSPELTVDTSPPRVDTRTDAIWKAK